jgi:hypothetical protein
MIIVTTTVTPTITEEITTEEIITDTETVNKLKFKRKKPSLKQLRWLFLFLQTILKKAFTILFFPNKI